MSKSLEQMKADAAEKRRLQTAAAEPRPPTNGTTPHAETPVARDEAEPLPEERESALMVTTPPPRWVPPVGQVQDIHRTPPHSVEAEQGVLGSMLLEPRTAIREARGRIDREYFYVPAHQTIFCALCEMFDDEGAVDLITFTQHLRDAGTLDHVGGPSFVTSLYIFVPTAANLRYYLDIVVDKFVLRQIIAAGTESVRRAYEEQDEVPALVDDVHARNEFVASLLTHRRTTLSVRRPSELVGMTFDENDNYFADRIIAAGQPCTFLGPGGVGKSRASLQLAVCMVTGRPFLDIETHAAGKKWLFIQSENNNRRLHHDLKNLIAALALTPDEIAALDRCLLIHTLEQDHDGFLTLNNPQNYAAVHSLIQDFKPDFVQWDPLNSLTDADLNSDMDMRAVVTAISTLTRAGNPHRVPFVLHHSLTGKAGAARAVGWDKSSYGRNSKVLQAWTRAQINLSPRSPDDPNLLIMSCGKNNNGKSFEEIGIKFHVEKGIYVPDEEFSPAEFREEVGIVNAAGQFKKRFSKEMLLAELSIMQGIKPVALRRLMDEQHGMSKSNFYRFAQQLHSEDLITESEGLWFKSSTKK